jgi:alpha-D-ribose 1-methylphosphonate 5-triphosphate synthase subunit PhnG
MELTRRWVLLMGAALAVWTAKMASVTPLFTVRAVDFAESQKNESRWTDRGQFLAQLPLDRYVQEKTKGATLDVSGEAWTRFLGDVLAAGRGRKSEKAWTSRVAADDLRWTLTPYRVFFRPDEEPLREIAAKFSEDEQRRYLVFDEGGRPSYLEVSFQVYDPDDFGFGSGFGGTPEPPTRFLYPFRKFSLWIALLGLAIYVLLPRPKRRPEAVYYQTWRVILGDFASMILFVPFFAVPIFVIGGSIQALTMAWPLVLMMWPLAFVGIWLLRMGAWYASYELFVTTGGIELSTYKERRLFPFADMTYLQPIVVKPPRWLVIASWFAVLAGRGRARIGAAGRALMLGGSASNGIGVGLKDGSSAFFWVTDQMGGKALKNAERMIDALEKAGIPRKDKPKVIAGIALPVGEDVKGRTVREGSGASLAALLLFPIVALIVISIVFLFGHPRRAAKTAGESSAPGAAMTREKAAPVSDADAVWAATFSHGDLTLGRAVLRTGDGGFAVAGYATGGANVDFFLAKVDGDGKILWEKTYPAELSDYGQFICPAGDGGYFLAGETRRSGDYLGGSMDARLIKTAVDGTLLWEKTWGKEEQDDMPLNLGPLSNGGCRLLVRTPNGVNVVEWDAGGAVVRDEMIALLSQFEDIEGIKAGAFADDGGFVLTGEEKGAGSNFLDAFIARYDARGKFLWKRSSGGPGKESGVSVIQLTDGGFAAAGAINLFDQDGENVYVLRTNAQGEEIGEYAPGGPGDQSGTAIVEAGDGAILVVGTTKEGEAPPGILILTIVRGQVEIADKRIAGGPRGAEGEALALAGDGGYVLVANRTTGGSGTTAFDLLKMKKK